MAQRRKQDKPTYKQKVNKKAGEQRRANTSKAVQQQQDRISAERRAELQQAVNRAEHEKIKELVAQFPKDMQPLSFDELLAMRIVAGKPVISLCLPKLLGDLDWESDPREAQGKLSWIFSEFRDLKWHIAEQRVMKERWMKLDLIFDPDDEENEISGISSVAHLWMKCKQFMSSVNRYRRDRSDECEQNFGPEFYVRFWRRSSNMGWKTYFMYNAFVARECKELRLALYDITCIEVKGLLQEYFPTVNFRVQRAGGYHGARISTKDKDREKSKFDGDLIREYCSLPLAYLCCVGRVT